MSEEDIELAGLTTNETTLDPERQQQARKYARIQRRLSFVDLAIGLVYLILWLVFRWSLSLKARLTSFTANEWLLVVIFTVIFGGILALINLPLSYYEGYILPHRFGLSTQNLHGWIVDQIKAGAIGGVLGLLLLEIIYAVLRAFPGTWWLWAAGIMLLLNVILANLAPVLLFPLFYKFQPLGEEYTDLEKRLLQLAEKVKTHVSGVYKFDMSQRTKAANAALTGLGNTRRIILGDTLLGKFTTDEIEVVLAHELGHQVHKDIPLGILIQSGITLVGFYLGLARIEPRRLCPGFQWAGGYCRFTFVGSDFRCLRTGHDAADQRLYALARAQRRPVRFANHLQWDRFRLCHDPPGKPEPGTSGSTRLGGILVPLSSGFAQAYRHGKGLPENGRERPSMIDTQRLPRFHTSRKSWSSKNR